MPYPEIQRTQPDEFKMEPEVTRQIPQNSDLSVSSPATLPASMYAFTLGGYEIRLDAADLINQRDQDKKQDNDPGYREHPSNQSRASVQEGLAEIHFWRRGEDSPKAAVEYIDRLAASVYEYPERTVSEHARILKPTVEEIKQWEPIVAQLGATERTEEFAWKASTDNVQSYQHLETGRHLHIDGETGQFYDQSRNVITREAALGHALPPSQETSLDVSKGDHQSYRQLWDIRENAMGNASSHHNTEGEAWMAFNTIPPSLRQEYSVTPHVQGQPDELYKVGYGRDPNEQQAHENKIYAALAEGRPLIHSELSQINTPLQQVQSHELAGSTSQAQNQHEQGLSL